MKRIPNIITASRIIFTMLLFFISNNDILFICLYLLCGLSDVLDGYIAGKYHFESSFGAMFDSFADFIFDILILTLLFKLIGIKIIYFILIILFIKLITFFVGYKKYKKLAFLHTWLNKVSGILLFIFPVIYLKYKSDIIIYILFVFAFISALEELIITLKSKELDLDIKCIFKIK